MEWIGTWLGNAAMNTISGVFGRNEELCNLKAQGLAAIRLMVFEKH